MTEKVCCICRYYIEGTDWEFGGYCNVGELTSVKTKINSTCPKWEPQEKKS